MNVRRIRPEDAKDFRELRLRALQTDPDAFESSYDREVDRPMQAWETWAALSSEGPDQAMFVAEVDDELVGLAGAFRTEDRPREMHLIAMWVDPAQRRRGIARELTRVILVWARRSDADEVVLWVVDGNEGARRLYEDAGFTPTGRSMPLTSNPDLIEHELVRSVGHGLRMPDGYADLEPMDVAERRSFVEWVMADRTTRLMDREDLPHAEATARVRARISEMLNAPAGTSHHFFTITAGMRREPHGWLWMIERRRDGSRIMTLEEVVVFEDFRGAGLAASAVESALVHTEFLGITTVETRIPIDHAAALRIAEGSGFVETSRTDVEVLLRCDIIPGPR